ncbi:MAG: PilZ domain-containing protein [Desulfobacterales bacterium]
MYQPHYIPRKHLRYALEALITFAKQYSEKLLTARMRNISDGGMYFETQFPVEPWSNVYIWIKQQPPGPHHKGVQIYEFYRSRVLWCRKVNQVDELGIGVVHVNKSRFSSGPEFICSICEDKISLGKVHFLNDFIYLCPDCHHRMEHCSGKNRENIIRFIEGNIF